MLRATATFALLLCVCPSACGGGGGGSSEPSVPASVPAGAGQVTIPMPGLWFIANVRVVGTNDPQPAIPSVNGGCVFGNTQIVTIDNESVDPTTIVNEFGVPLDWYVNTLNGRTAFFGFGLHNPQNPQEKVAVGFAAGSVSNNRIAAQLYYEIIGQSGVLFARFEFDLVRGPNLPVQEEALGGDNAGVAEGVLSPVLSTLRARLSR